MTVTVQPAIERLNKHSFTTQHQFEGTTFLGTSSWSFPGWSMVWDQSYKESQLAKAGLAAYAKHPLLNAVGLDRSFYAPLPVAQYEAYASAVHNDFRFLVKAPDLITGALQRGDKGKPAGLNPHHLDVQLALQEFVEPAVQGLGNRLGALVFQFSPLPKTWVQNSAAWIDRLGDFLGQLPQLPNGCHYAVEIRDAGLLTPRLIKTLAATGATYCIGLHDRLPPLERQLGAWKLLKSLRQPGQANPFICRWTLRKGLSYQAAKAQFGPFDRLHFNDHETTTELARQIQAQQAVGEVSLVIINKAEGCAPLSVKKLNRAVADLTIS
jgi:uncharacterized protein YecE (DUF72 family)